ncbi:CCA tRNA nucleotidyltransferase [Azospirillum sp.]|uniref:CCA tRNA nucleotidyltransferase n=1 Tax=Azospirillum sp. TaxID=34012 RepID=UPI002D456ECE|nr:CCA tRNA nucleotidyltransferase [Azospirillum sp.]HYD70201.1 CCA tRNA nucleotidyltransferase [Azospirillum sp.]
MQTPAGRLSPQPWMIAPETRAVLAALDRGGADARFVGGCVRDSWLGRPVKDIDIATHAPPDAVMRMLEDGGVRAIPTGIAHGTVTAVVDRKHYEITTLRRDVESFGRHARVEFTDDWKEDAARRDFTMNALSCTPDGLVYDPFGGLADMAAGRVRFVGDARQRIREDVLRLLRFFRFHAHYGRGAPDDAAMAACRELAPLLPTLSGERVHSEIFRLLTSEDPGHVWRLMQADGVMEFLLPDAVDAARLDRMVALQHALGEGADPLLRLAATLDTERAGALTVAEDLRLSNAERDRLCAIVEPKAAVSLADDAPARRRVLYRVGNAEVYRDLVRMAAVTAPGPVALDAVKAALATADELESLRFPLAGRDVLDLGVKPGPHIGTLLRQVEAWWIGQDFRPGREECLGELRGRIALLPPP